MSVDGCEYINPSLDDWSKNIVKYMYCFVVNFPVICATYPGVGDTK